MARCLPLLLVLLLTLPGCRSTGPRIDPFLGRTTVAPPGTNEVQPLSPDDYYTPPPQPASGGGRQGQAFPAVEDGAAKESRPGRPERLAGAVISDVSPSDQEQAVPSPIQAEISQVAGQDLRPPHDAGDGFHVIQTGHVAEIRVREAAGSTTGSKTHGTPAGASLEPDAEGIADDTSAPPSTSSDGRYAFDPSYRWLRGQLEYSRAGSQWKLRYIPIDGDTDQYGGSVVLDGAPPGEAEAGDFVTLRGTVRDQEASVGFAPRYEVQAVEPEET